MPTAKELCQVDLPNAQGHVRPMWRCDRCSIRMCNNCKVLKGGNRCPACEKPSTYSRDND